MTGSSLVVSTPPPVCEGPHPLDPLPADLYGKHRPEAVPPKPRRLIADIDATLGQQVLHVPQRQRVLHIHHDHRPDNLRRAVEVAERVSRFGHTATLGREQASANRFGLTEPSSPHWPCKAPATQRLGGARRAVAEGASGRTREPDPPEAGRAIPLKSNEYVHPQYPNHDFFKEALAQLFEYVL